MVVTHESIQFVVSTAMQVLLMRQEVLIFVIHEYLDCITGSFQLEHKTHLEYEFLQFCDILRPH